MISSGVRKRSSPLVLREGHETETNSPHVPITAACALGAVPAAASAATTDVTQASSENWSGYVAGGSQTLRHSQIVQDVSGSWVAPTAKCTTTTGGSYSAFWVGLGGAGQTEALEQAVPRPTAAPPVRPATTPGTSSCPPRR